MWPDVVLKREKKRVAACLVTTDWKVDIGTNYYRLFHLIVVKISTGSIILQVFCRLGHWNGIFSQTNWEQILKLILFTTFPCLCNTLWMTCSEQNKVQTLHFWMCLVSVSTQETYDRIYNLFIKHFSWNAISVHQKHKACSHSIFWLLSNR